MCSLDARCRWAITGTPIQNRLTDLGTLLHFLQAHPFDDLSFFDKEFLRPWKAHSDLSALDRLRALVKFITLRRSKKILHLKPREDHIRYLQFNPSERELYENIRSRTRDACAGLLGANASDKVDYVNVLAWIDNLRQICNLGLINEWSHLPPVQPASPRFYRIGSVETLDFSPVAVPTPTKDASGLDILDYVSQNMKARALEDSGLPSPVSNASSIPSTAVSQDLLNVSFDHSESGPVSPRSSEWPTPDPSTITTAMPTKIERLIQDLADNDGDGKR